MNQYVVNIYTQDKAATIEMKFGKIYMAKMVTFWFRPHLPFFTLLLMGIQIKLRKLRGSK